LIQFQLDVQTVWTGYFQLHSEVPAPALNHNRHSSAVAGISSVERQGRGFPGDFLADCAITTEHSGGRAAGQSRPERRQARRSDRVIIPKMCKLRAGLVIE
jgi:hypothetical protein